MVLKPDFKRRNNAPSCHKCLYTLGHVPVYDFCLSILSILNCTKSLKILSVMKIRQHIQFLFKLRKLPLRLCRISYFIRLVVSCSEESFFVFENEVSAIHGVRPLKTCPEPTKPRMFPYVSYNYRIEAKHIFLTIAYLGRSCEFFLEFWYFPYCRPPVEIN